MAEQLQNKEERIFYQALEMPPDQREAFLKEACGDDKELYNRIKALLKVNDIKDGFLESPLLDSPLTLDNPPDIVEPGGIIGRYKLLEKIGEGGMAVVYMAEQQEPIRRKVALKIIKSGMDTKQVIARFEAERQALAMMDHPNIAKVLDAGATETGRPYFVMELVHGVLITEYCDKNQLDTRQRLKLFIQVCQAVQHAHQKGIIHRDLKPSNVLVTMHDDKPVPKVIDFGIAKATNQRLTEKTVFTRFAHFIGTPTYMSPEQAQMSGLDIDTRSDIYSLGVLLYELLTGRTPFEEKELMQSGIDEMRKIIREQDPPKPSTKFATLQIEDQTETAIRHSTDSLRLLSLLRGDLDWIVMKCLEKDRTRRYETANGLAVDIIRHLNNEPVFARPPSVVYRIQKAWRRNKVFYSAAGMVVASLIVGISVSIWQAIKATRAELQANTNALLAEQNSKIAEQRAIEAKESEVNALRRSYDSDMSLAFRALEENLFGRVQDIVRQQIPEPGRPDFRGWEWRYAWAQSRSDAVHIWDTPELGEVAAVRISPDQRYLISSDFHYWITFYHHTRRLWNFKTREELTDVHLPGGSKYGFDFSNSGRYLALHRGRKDLHGGGNDESEIHIYDTTTWDLDTAVPSEAWINSLSFSHDDKALVAVGDTEAVLWDWRGKKIIQKWPFGDRGARLNVAAFFPDGHRLAIGGSNELKIIDVTTGNIEHRYHAQYGAITALAVSPDSHYVAIGSGYDMTKIGILNTTTWEQEPPLIGHSRSITSLMFTTNGKWLISSSDDSTIRVWDMADRTVKRVLKGHQSWVGSVALTSDESRAISGGTDKRILEWNLNAPMEPFREYQLAEQVRQVVFSADSRSFYTISENGLVSIWDTKTFTKQHSLSAELGKKSSLILSLDGNQLIAGTGEGQLWVLDAKKLQVIAQRKTKSERILPVGFSNEGRSLVTLEPFNKISLWNVETWQLKSTSETRLKVKFVDENFNIYAIPQDSNMLLYPSGADLVWWDLEQSKELACIRVNSYFPGSIAVSPSEPLLASTDRGDFLRLWNWQTYQPEGWLRGPRAFHGVAFSPEGQRLVAGSHNQGTLTLWDVPTRQEIARFGMSISAAINTVQFSPDGNMICAVDAKGAAHFWRAPSWDEINEIEAGQHTAERR